MHIVFFQYVAMGIIGKALFFRLIAHQTTIVAGNPKAPLLILAETRNHITCKTVGHRETLETLAHGRDIFHTIIKGAYPHTTFGIAGDGIDKTIVKLFTITRFRVHYYQAIIATYANTPIGQFVQRVYVPTHF